MDITPMVAADRLLVGGYGDGGFRIGENRVEGSVILFPDRALAWGPTTIDEITLESLEAVLAASDTVDILLVGMADRALPLQRELKAALSAKGIVAEIMSTAAACRTFNVLVAEDRPVAAAMLAV